MKSSHLSSALVITSCLLLIASLPTKAQRRRPVGQQPRTMSVEDEAKQQAEKYWRSVLARCGDSYLTKEFYTWSGPGSLAEDYRGYTVYEFKGIMIETRGQRIEQVPLSQADILNGVKRQGRGMEYTGDSYLNYAVARNGVHSDGDPPGKLYWWPWEDGRTGVWMRLRRYVKVNKTDGKWNFSDSYYSNLLKRRVPVKCDLSDVEWAGTEADYQQEISPTNTPDRVFSFPATRSGWMLIGSGHFTIEVSGQIDFGGITSTPQGVRRSGEGIMHALAPDLPFGAVIAKIGENGRSFVVGYSHRFDTQEQVYIAINDSDYSDNSGSYRIRIRY